MTANDGDDDFDSYWNELKPIARGRGKRLNLVGRRFWRLVVQAATGRRTASGSAIWSCLCDCGNVRERSTDNLMKGKAKSCGCLRGKIV
jgi:hypothetical protein